MTSSVGKQVQIILRENTPAGATVRETATSATLGTSFAASPSRRPRWAAGTR